MYFLLRTPSVQTYITSKITTKLSDQLNTTISIEGVDIDFIKKVVLEGIYLEDQQQDTLLYADRLRVDIGLFALFGKKIVLDEILLENAYVNLYTVDDSATLNFAFIPKAFADTTQQDTTTEAGWSFDLKEVMLSDTRFSYNDFTTSMKMGLVVKDFLVDLKTLGLEESHIEADAIDIDGLDFNFLHLASETPSSDTVMVSDTASAAPLNPSGFRFTVDQFSVKNSNIAFVSDTAAAPGKINFGNLALQNLLINIEDIDIGENIVLANVKNMAFLENNSTFQLKSLAVNLALEMPSLKAELTKLVTNHSALNGQIGLSLPDMHQPDSLLKTVFLNAALDSTRIGLADASYFSSALDSLPALTRMVVQIAGKVAVDSGNARMEDFQLMAGENAYLKANALIKGLNNFEHAYMDIDVKSLVADVDFMAQFLPPNTLPPSLKKAGDITLKARAEGYLSDADLVANLTSEIGRVSANVNYKKQKGNDFRLHGALNAYRLDLQAITGNDSIGMATINTNFSANNINGQFSADTLALVVKSLQYNRYTYEDLKLGASFKDSLLLSRIWYEDDNLRMDINAKASLKEADSWLTLNGEIPEMDLLKLQLTPDSILLRTAIKADMEDLDPDQIDGYLRLSNTILIDGARKFVLDTFQIRANTTDTIRQFFMDSDFVDASLQGKFAFASLPGMINDFTTYYFTALRDTAATPPQDQYLELKIDIKDEPMLVRAFMPSLALPEPSSIYAEYHENNRLMRIDIQIPAIQYKDYRVQSFEIKANTENRDNIKFDINSDHIAIGENLTIPDFGLEGSFIQDMLQFNIFIANSEAPSYLDFNGFLTNDQDTIILEILESSLAVEGDEWRIPNDAVVQYATNFLSVHNFFLKQEEQEISLQTHEEKTENALLDLEVKNFKVGDVLTILDMEDYEVSGELNGAANITNVFSLDQVKAAFSIDNLVVNGQEAGKLSLEAEKSVLDVPIQAALQIKGAQNNLSLEGTYNLSDSLSPIDMQLAITKFRLEQWGVFAQEYVTDLEGNVRADIAITGSPGKPVVEGYFAFDPESQMRINAIGSLYRLDDQRINLTESSIGLDNFTIMDSASHKLHIDGEIRHQYFQDFDLDLAVNTPEFKFFHAKQQYSPAFYGTINAGADITVKGPIENLNIRGALTTKEGTNPIVALVDDPDVASHASFINFVNTNAYLSADSIPDTTQTQNTTVELTGISLYLTLHVTQDAAVEILIDPVSGDKLLAVGEGDIRVQMSPTGDMNIQGTYVLDRGSYSLSFMNILRKQFQIREGSTINMAGDPLGAEFQITAVYSTEASAGSLYPEQTATPGATASQLNVKQPVNVVLNLKGTLESPEVSFDIELPAITDPNNAIVQRIKMIKEDQSQLYQQVFGLIVLNRFIPSSGGLGSGGGTASVINQRVDASVSSILTNQLSRLTQDYLGGVELSVDLESRNPNETSFENKDLQIQLSKQLFNERLTVSVGGTSSLGNQPGAPGGDNAALLGDFEILYRINESGTLNLRIFQSNTRDIFTQAIRQRQGTSLTYVKSFDEIFVSEKEKKVLRAE